VSQFPVSQPASNPMPSRVTVAIGVEPLAGLTNHVGGAVVGRPGLGALSVANRGQDRGSSVPFGLVRRMLSAA